MTRVSTVTITSNATWTAADGPYILDGDVTVAAGATLTLQPGVIVKFNGAARKIWVNGVLNAVGSPSARITFTSIQDDAIGGDSGGDGASVGAAGQWAEIGIRPGSTGSVLANVDVRFGGDGTSDWNHGVISVANGASLTVEQSTISDNERSGLKIGSGGTASLRSSQVLRNGNGVSVNAASVSIRDGSTVADNRVDGIWFNLPTSTPYPPPSSVTTTDITRNGRHGVFINANGDFPIGSMPVGNANNIWGNLDASGRQLSVSGLPAFKDAAVNWRGNFWGDDVYYYVNPSDCSSSAPNANGRLAYRSSGTNPPSSPLSGGTYIISKPYPQPNVTCAYGSFRISECEFSSTYITAADILVEYPPSGRDVADAVACAGASGLVLESLQSDFSAVSPNLTATYGLDEGETHSSVVASYEETIASLFTELASFGDVSYVYPGDAPVNRLALRIPLPDVRIAPTFPAQPCWPYDWWPIEGRIQAGASYTPPHVGRRFVYQAFRWDERTVVGLRGCRSNITLEADAVADDSDGLTYLGKRAVKGISNLPKRYDDNTELDFGGTTSWTIGSADAQLVQADVVYTTLIRTKEGSANVDRMHARFQNGVRIPAGCHNANCVYPATAYSDHVATHWFNVPGSCRWFDPQIQCQN